MERNNIGSLTDYILGVLGEEYIDDVNLTIFYLLDKFTNVLPHSPLCGLKKRIGDIIVRLINNPASCSELNFMDTVGCYASEQFLMIYGQNKAVSLYVTLEVYKDEHQVILRRDNDNVVAVFGEITHPSFPYIKDLVLTKNAEPVAVYGEVVDFPKTNEFK